MTSSSSPEPSSETTNPNNLVVAAKLIKLGRIVDTELQNWLTYLSQIPPSTFADITSGPITHQVKVAALRHLLEGIPARHRALVDAYHTENVDHVELSERCAVLMEGLDNADLNGFYDHKMLKAKKFREEAAAMDEEMRDLEQGRSAELKELVGMYVELELLKDEGALGEAELKMLVEAMSELGLSPGDGLGDEIAGNPAGVSGGT